MHFLLEWARRLESAPVRSSIQGIAMEIPRLKSAPSTTQVPMCTPIARKSTAVFPLNGSNWMEVDQLTAPRQLPVKAPCRGMAIFSFIPLQQATFIPGHGLTEYGKPQFRSTPHIILEELLPMCSNWTEESPLGSRKFLKISAEEERGKPGPSLLVYRLEV